MSFNPFNDGYLDDKAEYLWDELFEYWARSIRVSRFPLSGDVTQFISAWGEVFGQLGFFNFNLTGSRDPRAEKRISGQYSYGRQLGRVMEVLEPLVELNKPYIEKHYGQKRVSEFEDMAQDIRRLKGSKPRNNVEALRIVKQWQGQMKAEDFSVRLKELVSELNKLIEPPPPPTAESESGKTSAAESGAGTGGAGAAALTPAAGAAAAPPSP